MSELETQIRRTIALEMGPVIGAVDSHILKVIHHSSTRKSQGASELSDIDFAIVLDNDAFFKELDLQEIVADQIQAALWKYSLQVGTGRLNAHLTILSSQVIDNPKKYLKNENTFKILDEILTKGEIVYKRK